MIEALAGAVLLGDGLFELIIGDQPAFEKDASDAHALRLYR